MLIGLFCSFDIYAYLILTEARARGESTRAGGGEGGREKRHADDVEGLAASVFGGEITLEELGSLTSLPSLRRGAFGGGGGSPLKGLLAEARSAIAFLERTYMLVTGLFLNAQTQTEREREREREERETEREQHNTH